MEKIKANLQNQTIESNSSSAFNLYDKSCLGEKHSGKISYSLYEAFYLLQENKLEIFSKGKKINEDKILSKFSKLDKKFSLKYTVFKDLRKKGLILKAALKFGADFRVYSKGQKPSTNHAQWLLCVYPENSKLNWSDFAAKSRIAHSTAKKLLIAIVDSENSSSYYESNWAKL